MGPARRVVARPPRGDGRSRPHRRRHLDGDEPERRRRNGAEPARHAGPAAGKRSRGELPLMALDHATAADAAAAMSGWTPLPGAASTWCWRTAPGRSSSAARARPAAGRTLPHGVSMVTAHDPNDLTSPRTARHLPRFQRRRTRRTGRLGRLAPHPGRPARRPGGADQRRSPSGFRHGLLVFCRAPGGRAAHMVVRPGPPHEAGFRAGLLRAGRGCYTRGLRTPITPRRQTESFPQPRQFRSESGRISTRHLATVSPNDAAPVQPACATSPTPPIRISPRASA